MIIGTTFSLEDCTFRMEQDFWSDLNDIYSKNDRFVKLELSPLLPKDLEAMTEKFLGMQRKDICPELLKEVVVQSGGMPRFATKILQGIQERIESEKSGRKLEKNDSVSDIILHRIDSFDLSLRNTLNVGAVLGESFTLSDIVAAMKEGSDSREVDLRRQVVEALKLSVTEGILLARSQDGQKLDGEAVSDEDDIVFTFYHHVWPSTLLGLMLDSRKCDLHRKIATSMDRRLEKEEVSIDFKLKLFKHWRTTGDTVKTIAVALLAGKELESDLSIESDPSKISQSFSVYEETLTMFGYQPYILDHTTNNRTAQLTMADANYDERIAGFSSHVLSILEAEDLSDILRVMVAYGGALVSAGKNKESVAMYEDALRIFQLAKSSFKMKDRSVVFPAFVGLSKAIASGHLKQDAQFRYEQAMLRRFLDETKIHGRLIHHIYALFLQMDFYSRQDELEKALAVQSVIKRLYKDAHSNLLCEVYGMDVGALSFSFASFYELVKGEKKQALRSCRLVLKDLLNKIKSDYEQAFSIVYPLVLILKEAGFSTEARALFNKAVIEPFGNLAGKKDRFSLPYIHESLLVLLDLSGKIKVNQDKKMELVDWAGKRENIVFNESTNIALGRLGQCGNTISAEICYLLASELDDCGERDFILEAGRQLCSHAIEFHRKYGTTLARKRAQNIAKKIESLN